MYSIYSKLKNNLVFLFCLEDMVSCGFVGFIGRGMIVIIGSYCMYDFGECRIFEVLEIKVS